MTNPEVRQKQSALKIHKKTDSSGGTSISTHTESKINSLKGKGRPLSLDVKDYFQPRFGVDLDDVRVHTDSNADRLARAIRARAFTYGNDVVFAKGEYKPETIGGKRLVAHELTHVLQQRGDKK
ncbi:MAG: DUF4157 domain-containing protein [Spirochaetales bacterium]|nr:DUF4157 domain-containing protein [Spirochaetales bacterium]